MFVSELLDGSYMDAACLPPRTRKDFKKLKKVRQQNVQK